MATNASAGSIILASHCKINHGNDLRWNLEFRFYLGHASVTRKSKRRKGVMLVTQKRGVSSLGARIGRRGSVAGGQWSVVRCQV
jgi:hypothetical protein